MIFILHKKHMYIEELRHQINKHIIRHNFCLDLHFFYGIYNLYISNNNK